MTKQLSQHFRCTALRIIVSRPKLSFVYCTEKASGWFFRHEMSDLFDFCLVGVPQYMCHTQQFSRSEDIPAHCVSLVWHMDVSSVATFGVCSCVHGYRPSRKDPSCSNSIGGAPSGLCGPSEGVTGPRATGLRPLR